MNMDGPADPIDVPVTDAGDVRVGHLVSPRSLEGLDDDHPIVLLGFPSDEGVRRNGGRPGAAAGCDRIRHWFYRMTPDGGDAERHEAILRKIADLGNVPCCGDVERDQQRLADIVGRLLSHHRFPVILGGGHETTYGHFLGYPRSGRQVSIVNIDAHADVRPLIDGRGHSGSPFRQALEDPSGACRSYAVYGLNPAATSASHLAYLREKGAGFRSNEQFGWNDVYRAYEGAPPILATFDLDALDQRDAPGVSAPNPNGMSKRMWFSLAYLAGRSAAVRSFDVVELNPRCDVDDRTARLAALTIWAFTRGLAWRDVPGG